MKSDAIYQERVMPAMAIPIAVATVKVGQLLRQLQQVFASAGRKGRFDQCLCLLHIPRSTAYDLIERYEILEALPPAILQAADEVGLDLGAPKLRPQVQALSSSRADLDPTTARTMIEPLTKKAKREKRAKFGPGITDDEKAVYSLFDALRRSTGDLSAVKKKDLLTKALDLYAYYVLNYDKPATITLMPTKAENDWVLNPAAGKSHRPEVAA
jgi:hypothetical protein